MAFPVQVGGGVDTPPQRGGSSSSLITREGLKGKSFQNLQTDLPESEC